MRNNATKRNLEFKGIKQLNRLKYKYELVSKLGSHMTFSKSEYTIISQVEDDKDELPQASRNSNRQKTTTN